MTADSRKDRYSESLDAAAPKLLDEQELRLQYRHKDETVVTNILKDGFRIKCPVTGRNRYMDPEYEEYKKHEIQRLENEFRENMAFEHVYKRLPKG